MDFFFTLCISFGSRTQSLVSVSPFELKYRRFSHLKIVPSLNVPDTILFQNDLPYMWYFVKDRCLKRKSNIKLTLEEIEKKFLRKIPKSGIVGVYINQSSSKDGEKMIFEYLTAPQFSFYLYIYIIILVFVLPETFLYEKQMTQKHGVLQRFIQPKAEHNCNETPFSQEIFVINIKYKS